MCFDSSAPERPLPPAVEPVTIRQDAEALARRRRKSQADRVDTTTLTIDPALNAGRGTGVQIPPP